MSAGSRPTRDALTHRLAVRVHASPCRALTPFFFLLHGCNYGWHSFCHHGRQINFRYIPLEVVSTLQQDMVPLSVLPGDVLMETCDLSTEVYFMCSGEVEVGGRLQPFHGARSARLLVPGPAPP